MSRSHGREPEFGISRLHLEQLSQVAFDPKPLELLIDFFGGISNGIRALKPGPASLTVRALPARQANLYARKHQPFESPAVECRPEPATDDDRAIGITKCAFSELHRCRSSLTGRRIAPPTRMMPSTPGAM